MVVGGNPARIICSVDKYIEKNSKYNTHTKGMTDKEKRIFLTRMSDELFLNK